VFPFEDGECIFTYGAKWEVSADKKAFLTSEIGESALLMRFALTDECLILFFSV
jgi:hypothetical protein